MYVPIAIVVAMGAGWLAFAWLLARRRGEGDLMAPPRPAPAPAPAGPPSALPLSRDLTPEVEDEVRALMAQNRKIDAIKRVRETTGLGLAEAKLLVERL